MGYIEIYEKAKEIIGEENIDDYRPAVFTTEHATFLSGVEVYVPNTIMIWLKNGDCIWYRSRNEET